MFIVKIRGLLFLQVTHVEDTVHSGLRPLEGGSERMHFWIRYR